MGPSKPRCWRALRPGRRCWIIARGRAGIGGQLVDEDHGVQQRATRFDHCRSIATIPQAATALVPAVECSGEPAAQRLHGPAQPWFLPVCRQPGDDQQSVRVQGHPLALERGLQRPEERASILVVTEHRFAVVPAQHVTGVRNTCQRQARQSGHTMRRRRSGAAMRLDHLTHGRIRCLAQRRLAAAGEHDEADRAADRLLVEAHQSEIAFGTQCRWLGGRGLVAPARPSPAAPAQDQSAQAAPTTMRRAPCRRQRLAVQPLTEAEPGLDRVAEGVAKIQDGADVALALVARDV